MVIKIQKRTGLDDMETIAVWDETEGWIEGDARFMEDDIYEEYTAEQMIDEFDGPNVFATVEDDVEESQTTWGEGA